MKHRDRIGLALVGLVLFISLWWWWPTRNRPIRNPNSEDMRRNPFALVVPVNVNNV